MRSGGPQHEHARRAAAAIDIGGTKIATAVIGEDGTVIGEVRRPSQGLTPHYATEQLIADLAAAVTAASHDGWSVESLGVGATGRHDASSGCLGAVDAVLPGWSASPLPTRIAAGLNLPLRALLNDADAAAIAECTIGAGAGASPCAVVMMGTGIGVAMLRDGRLVTGANGAHPEFGHSTVALDGSLCLCGGRGCWESFAGGAAIERAWYAVAPSVPQRTAAEIFSASDAGEALATAIVNAATRATALAMANLAVAYLPERIVVGGGIAAQWERFLPAVEREIGRRSAILSQLPEFRAARFGTEAVLVGAGRACLQGIVAP